MATWIECRYRYLRAPATNISQTNTIDLPPRLRRPVVADLQQDAAAGREQFHQEGNEREHQGDDGAAEEPDEVREAPSTSRQTEIMPNCHR